MLASMTENEILKRKQIEPEKLVIKNREGKWVLTANRLHYLFEFSFLTLLFACYFIYFIPLTKKCAIRSKLLAKYFF